MQLALGLATGAFDAPQKDAALAELHTLHATRLELLHGAYSRFGWHHPGPLPFYALAPLYLLSGLSSSALLVGAQLIAGVSVVGILRTLRDLVRDPRGQLVAFAFASLLHLVLARQAVHAPFWNPVLALLPLVWLILVAARGRPLWAATALHAWVVQCHVGFAPVATVAWLWIAWRRRHDRSRTAWAAAIVAGAVCWAPPALEALALGGGNLASLVGFFATGQGPALAPLSATVPALAVQLTEPLPTLTLAPPLAAVAALVALIGALALAARRGTPHAPLALLLVATSLASLGGVRGPLARHVLLWGSAVGWFAWLVLLTSWSRGESARRSVWLGVVAVVAVVALHAALVWSAYQTAAVRLRPPQRAVQEAARYLDGLARAAPELVLDLADEGAVRHAASLVLALERDHGGAPLLHERWRFVFGDAQRYSPEARPRWRVVVTRELLPDLRVLFESPTLLLQTAVPVGAGLYRDGEPAYRAWDDLREPAPLSRRPRLHDRRVALEGSPETGPHCVRLGGAGRPGGLTMQLQAPAAGLRLSTAAGDGWHVEASAAEGGPWRRLGTSTAGEGSGMQTREVRFAEPTEAWLRLVPVALGGGQSLSEVSPLPP